MQVITFSLKLLSFLPLRVLYLLSNFLGWMLHRVVGYRKSIVRTNLERSFPEASSLEISRIQRAYYRYLADVVLETVKLWSMGSRDLKDRVEFEEPDLLRNLQKKGKNIILLMGHSGNWEWAGSATSLHYDLHLLPVYRRVKEEAINEFFIDVRSRFGANPILDRHAFQGIRKAKSPHAVALLGDQTPNAKKGLWIEFLNQQTAFFRGTEVLLKRLDYEVVFAHVRIKSRGKYSIHLETFTREASEDAFEVTRKFVAFLEREINAQPHNWLWSHKRWKHQKPDGATTILR